jgi:hypothetical protein
MIFGCRLSAIEGDQPPLPPMANPMLPPICRRLAADCKSAPNAVAPQTKNGEEINYFLHRFENSVKK